MSAKHKALRAKMYEAFESADLRGKSEDEVREAIKANLVQLGLTANIGWILHAGTVFDRDFQVQFNIPGDGWSDRWPAWAFEAARDALLHERRVLVISDGEPFGRNLLQVLVLNTPV